MKKVLLIFGIVTTIMSCNSNKNKKTTDTARAGSSVNTPPPTNDTPLLITLNGIKKADADKMFQQFLNYRSQDIKPTQKSIWFDSVTFHRIVALLNKERGPDPVSGPDKYGQTDGMRIYFVSDTTINSGKLNNSIILVSTQNAGPSDSVPSKARHHDYYNHEDNILFHENPDTLKGIASTRYPHNWGENLYIFGIYKDDVSSCDEPHYTSRKRAYEMVNQFGKGPITTKAEWFNIGLLRLLDSTPHDGIRIYFCRHPQTYNNKPDTDANKENFVLVSTHTHTFLRKPYHADNFNCKASLGFFKEKNNWDWYREHLFQSTGGGDDNGELCPSHCD